MAGSRKVAFAIIKDVAHRIMSGNPFVTYSELAQSINYGSGSGQGLGPHLDVAYKMCREHGLPDVTCMVVTKQSIGSDNPLPSAESFNDEGIWPMSGVHKNDVPALQQKALAFDWESIPQLNR